MKISLNTNSNSVAVQYDENLFEFISDDGQIEKIIIDKIIASEKASQYDTLIIALLKRLKNYSERCNFAKKITKNVNIDINFVDKLIDCLHNDTILKFNIGIDLVHDVEKPIFIDHCVKKYGDSIKKDDYIFFCQQCENISLIECFEKNNKINYSDVIQLIANRDHCNNNAKFITYLIEKYNKDISKHELEILLCSLYDKCYDNIAKFIKTYITQSTKNYSNIE